MSLNVDVEVEPTVLGDFHPPDAEVVIESTWKSYRPAVADASTKTEPLPVADQETQSIERDNKATQTDEVPVAKSPKYDAAGVLRFFDKVLPLVLKELEKNAENAATYYSLSSSRTTKMEGQPTLLHELRAFGEDEKRKALIITSISWSATGQTVALAYGKYDVTGWCTTPGGLACWNLGREDCNPTRPDTKIETDNCLMSCAFHPAHPALIAGGTFNGELYVWDLSKEGDLQRGKSNSLSEVAHLEPIKSICWQYSIADSNKYANRAQAYRIITLGADGRVLVWFWHKMEHPVYGYELTYHVGNDRKIVWGGSCMSFQRSQGSDSATFVAGTEGGKIFKCFYDFNELAAKDFAKMLVEKTGGGDRIELRCPIKDGEYTAHAGPVTSVEFAPYQRELFLSAGIDGTVRLYNILQGRPVMTLEPCDQPVHAVQWSPFRPLVFAAACGDGYVYLYDFMEARELVAPSVVLEVNSEQQPVRALAFNHKEPSLLATSSAFAAQIWKMPEAWAEVHRGEQSFLKRLAQGDDPDDVIKSLEITD